MRQRLEYLKDLKSKGFRSLAEAEQEIENAKRKDDKYNKKKDELYGDKVKII